MKKLYKTLIVEDHALTAKGIIGTLDEIKSSTGIQFDIQNVSNCADALATLRIKPSFDLIFLDIRLEPQPEIGMHSGEDLGIEIRKHYPGTVIIVSTVFHEPIQIKCILNNVNPDGFFVKGDMDSESLVLAVKTVLNTPPYYSPTVTNFLRNSGSDMNLKIDSLDRQLLFELDKGLTLDKIAEILPLSRAAIAKRKQKLKRIFGVEGGNTRDLTIKAREKGFV